MSQPEGWPREIIKTTRGGVPGGHFTFKRPISGDPAIPRQTEWLSIPLRHSDIVVDIGAFVGTYATRCARYPVQHVIAYEPAPRSFTVLEKNRGNLPNFTIEEAAVVWDDRKEVHLVVSEGIGWTNSIIRFEGSGALITVKTVNYADIVRGASIVKIDVEGAEYSYPVVQPSLRAIIIDFHPVPQRPWYLKAQSMIAEFEAAGFECVVEPHWTEDWGGNGSWIRPRKTTGECEPLMRGKRCCGCGTKINTDGKGLCESCWPLWSEKERDGFERA